MKVIHISQICKYDVSSNITLTNHTSLCDHSLPSYPDSHTCLQLSVVVIYFHSLLSSRVGRACTQTRCGLACCSLSGVETETNTGLVSPVPPVLYKDTFAVCSAQIRVILLGCNEILFSGEFWVYEVAHLFINIIEIYYLWNCCDFGNSLVFEGDVISSNSAIVLQNKLFEHL